MSKNVMIVGGHGQVSLRLARLLSPSHNITSTIRTPSHESDITSLGPTVKPLLISLEDAPVEEFATAFQNQDVVYFCAGAGGRGGEEGTKKVDFEGAVKVFDAIERVGDGPERRPRLVLVSSIDVRDPEKIPAHYTEHDIEVSKKYREALGTYVKWKYEADKNLVRRTAFKWTIVRPSGLRDEPGTGRVRIGRTPLRPGISRDDVAKTLALLVDRDDAAGLAIDVIGGDTPVEEALDAFIKKGETDFLG